MSVSPKLSLKLVLNGWKKQPHDKPKLSPVKMIENVQNLLHTTVEFDCVYGSSSMIAYFKTFTESEMNEFLDYYYVEHVNKNKVSEDPNLIYPHLLNNYLLTVNQVKLILEKFESMENPSEKHLEIKNKMTCYIEGLEKNASEWKNKYDNLEIRSIEIEAKLREEIANLKEQSDTVIIDNPSMDQMNSQYNLAAARKFYLNYQNTQTEPIKEHSSHIDDLNQLRNDHQILNQQFEKMRKELELKNKQIEEFNQHKETIRKKIAELNS